ncbi:alpha-humulene synthase-like [Cryptomeria japonica]|uniref:alpha-humulene synthase-like n=1 Tax=Cryptomeria japonica TaxID=3369 RepID=UPI0027D9ECEC|nr:alpha-humulene synthase-like [Cryptomeria japonica]
MIPLDYICDDVNAELMVMGFISLLLTSGQRPISEICISKSLRDTLLPCSKEEPQQTIMRHMLEAAVVAIVPKTCGGKNDDNMKSSREEHVVRSMLNLLRASTVAFPEETIMQEAKVFSSHIKAVFSKRWSMHALMNGLVLLSYVRLKDVKILDLAKLNFNISQCVYKTEMKTLSSWWLDSGITKLIALRERTIEYLLIGISVANEIEFGITRIAVVKVATLATILDDLFDDYLSLEQVELVVEVIIQGWNVSLIQNFPNNFKAVVEFVSKTVNELLSDANKKQGRDMTQFLTKAWADYAKASLQQARWNKSGYVPTYNEYINIAKISAGIGPISLHSILLTTILENNDIEKTFINQSRLCELAWLSIRLVDDAQDFQDEQIHGQTASAISSYMRDHLECSEDDALWPQETEKPTEKKTKAEVHIETEQSTITETLKQFEKPSKVEMQTQIDPPEESASKMDTFDGSKEDPSEPSSVAKRTNFDDPTVA